MNESLVQSPAQSTDQPLWRRHTKSAGLAGGLVVGGVLASRLTAGASTTDDPATEAPSTSSGQPDMTADRSQPQRPDEELLTGDLLQGVTDTALAAYPEATIMRVETDSDGVYEAHLVTADGQPVTVEVDENLTVTGTEQAGGGEGDGDGRGPAHGPGPQRGPPG